MPFESLKSIMEETALKAGKAIMEIYHQKEGSVEYKGDSSPVTQADKNAEEIILKALDSNYPNIPVVAEESFSEGNVPDIKNTPFFLVDPLDGTKEFIKKRSDFTVNIALIIEGVPVSGIVYAPAREVAWLAHKGISEKIDYSSGNRDVSQIRVRRTTGGHEIAVVSNSHNNDDTENYLKNFPIKERINAGSSLKFCLIAEGLADIYPRFGRTMEWDTAAGDAVLRAAGGRTFTTEGPLLLYGKTNQKTDTDFANPFFIADKG